MKKEAKVAPMSEEQKTLIAAQQFAEVAKLCSNIRTALFSGQNIKVNDIHHVVGVHYDLFSGEPFLELFESSSRGFSSVPVRLVVQFKEEPFYSSIYEAVISFVVPVNDVNYE